MADHVVLQVRDAIIAKLKAGVAAVANRVYRFDEVEVGVVDEASMPCLIVLLGDDIAEIAGVNGSATDQPAVLEDLRPTVWVHCVVKQQGDVEAAAYNLRRDVEATLLATNAARTLDGKVVGLVRLGASNNREDALDLGAFVSSLQIEVQIRHLDSLPDSFSY